MYEDEDRAGIDLGGRARGSLSRPHSLSSGGAIFHLSVTRSSRAKGHSARAAAAYIQREAEYSRDRGDELVYAESGHMPGWAEAEPMTYWEAADVHERANGRLCNRLEMALPLALSAAERQELAVGFAHQLTDAERLPYTLAIHAGDGHNPHCHLLISERGNDGRERSPELWFKRYNAAAPERGGAEKSTALRGKDWVVETRAAWAEQTNLALERAGHAVRIDHRSLEAQGVERVPMMKLGRAVYEMEARGLETDRGNEAWERARANAELERDREQEEARQAELARQRAAEEAQRQREQAQARGRDRAEIERARAVIQAQEPEPERAREREQARLPAPADVARDPSVEEKIAALEDPAERAKAWKLLETIRSEVAAQERPISRAREQERGRDRDDFDRER